MNETSLYLLALARRNAEVYAANPKTQAIMVTGSVAEGEADAYSDIDMCLYYKELPDEDALTMARQNIGGSERLWCLGDRSVGALAEAFHVEGVECQFSHVTVAAWERDMGVVLDQLEVTSPLQKALSGILTCKPLYGETILEQWREKAAHYPDSLALAMVEKHLNFVPVWAMPERFVERDAALWLHQIMVEAEQNLLGVLAGLNRLYYSTFQFKRMDAFIGKMRIAPEDLSRRLKRMLTSDPSAIIEQLKGLVSETVDLVELHMPTADTSKIRQQLAKQQQQRKPSPDSE